MSLMQRLRSFGPARQGLAALEFAILLPMMLLLLFGAVDLIDVLQSNRRVQNAAASLADVIARDTEVDDNEVAGLWAALGVLMYPDSGATMQVRVTSISIESATTARVVWSEGHGGMSALNEGETIDLPDAMMNPGTSVIFAETDYEYQSPTGFLLAGPVHIRHEAYRRSRLIDPIPREED